MGKFLAIFNGAATNDERGAMTPVDSDLFVQRWGAWAGAIGDSLIDPGAPLSRKVRVTADDVASFEDSKTAYAIVEATSLDQAVEMFATHPHLDLIAGNSIEVIECPAPPT